MGTELATISVGEIQSMAEQVAKSRMYNMDPSQAFVLMMICQAKGEHPIEAVLRYDIIQGKPAKKAVAILADFQAAGGRYKWLKRTETECEGEFWHPELYPDHEIVSYSMTDAKRAGLGEKDNYRKNPKAMLVARVTSQAIRLVMPGIVAGIHTPEELEDSTTIIDVTPREPGPDLNSKAAIRQAFSKPEVAQVADVESGTGPFAATFWGDCLLAIVEKFNSQWCSECKTHNVHLSERMAAPMSRFNLANEIATRALAMNLVEKPDKRSNQWATGVCEFLYDGQRDWLKAQVRDYWRAKLADCRENVGSPLAQAQSPSPQDAALAATEEPDRGDAFTPGEQSDAERMAAEDAVMG